MKIVILDGYDINPGDLNWGAVETLGETIIYEEMPDDEPETISSHIGDAEIVIVNKATIGREAIDACPELTLICEIATGYNNIDTAYAHEKNITVCNVPHYGTDSVAQFTFALLLEITSHVGLHNLGVHAGKWEASGQWCYCEKPLIELAGKTMGIIGFGDIGRQVGRIARVMGMKVLAYNRSECAQGREIATYVDLDTLLAQSDVISLHIPLFPETEEIINADTLAKIKPGAILLNTGRGGLINEHDVAQALKSGRLKAAAVDVVSREPICGNNPLLKAPNCYITPHIAWVTIEARSRLIQMTAENIRGYLAGKPVHVVN